MNVEELTQTVELLAKAQDAIVDGSAYPTQGIADNAHRFRPIGIGFANLAALLLTLGGSLRLDRRP